MQRFGGNAAVAGFLTGLQPVQPVGGSRARAAISGGTRLQRVETTAGSDGSPAPGGSRLTSPRFKDEPVLEACFEDRGRLGPPARGGAVRAVQQALVDSGIDVGPSGIDGSYGQDTANAVRTFKKRERLGFEQFGDVGPGTMHRLDQLFPPAPLLEPDVAEKEEEDFCPFTPDIVQAAVNRSPAQDKAKVGASAADGPIRAGGAGTHIDIPTAVARFKDRVNVSNARPLDDFGTRLETNVTNAGQFFWGMQMFESVLGELAGIGSDASDADAVRFRDTGRNAALALYTLKPAGKELAELGGIAASTSSPQKARMQKLLQATRLSAGALEQLLWSQLNSRPDASLPQLETFRSFSVLSSLKRFDKTSCGTHALTVAARLKAKGGLVPRDRSVPTFSAFISAGSGVRDRRPVPGGSVNHRGDVIAQTGVIGAVARAQHGLDAGFLVHARVLSGQGYGTAHDVHANPRAVPQPLGPPPEEHSLLLIGFDGGTFVFNDPDARVSHSPEEGFGLLHFDLAADRLSTANDDRDMVVNPDGFHVGRDEKRYQVISLVSV
jgi:peptidoglycan hydrolase-like protein with peptidoglycan-binding domain